MNAQKLELSKFLVYVQNELEWSDEERIAFSKFLRIKEVIWTEDGKQHVWTDKAKQALDEFKEINSS